MKWLSLPQRPWNFANIIGKAYAERYNCLYGSDSSFDPAASGPPQRGPSYISELSGSEPLLHMLGNCIDVRKLNDWQRADDFATTIEAALKNPADDFWKDFDISYPAFMRMLPWDSHLPQNLHFEFAYSEHHSIITDIARFFYSEMQNISNFFVSSYRGMC